MAGKGTAIAVKSRRRYWTLAASAGLIVLWPTCNGAAVDLAQQETAPVAAAAPEPVHAAFVRYADVTGDEKEDEVTLDVTGESFDAPFTWTLTIESEGKLVFQRVSDDTAINPNFPREMKKADADDSVARNFGGRGAAARPLVKEDRAAEFKEQYYFEFILRNLLLPASSLREGQPVLEPGYAGSVYHVAKKYLRKTCRLPEEKADAIVEDIVRRLKDDKTVLLNVPVSPVEAMPPMLYVPQVNGFVPVFELPGS